MQAREGLFLPFLRSPGRGERLGQRGLLVEQLDAAVTNAARLHQHDLATRRQQVRDHARRVVEER